MSDRRKSLNTLVQSPTSELKLQPLWMLHAKRLDKQTSKYVFSVAQFPFRLTMINSFLVSVAKLSACMRLLKF